MSNKRRQLVKIKIQLTL